ncbi:MAG TPA: OsmC family peroxiredoxin, partial [Cellulomonas sp.]
VRASGLSDPEHDRYPELYEELVVDLSGLDESQRERLVAIVNRAVDLHCTVGRTLQHGASTQLTIAGED